MKYAGDYYAKLKKLAKTQSNLNNLCWNIEKWERDIRFKRKSPDTSVYMIDKSVEWKDEDLIVVEDIFNQFNKAMRDLASQQRMAKDYNNNKEFFEGYTKFMIDNTTINWDVVYDRYRQMLYATGIDMRAVTNYAVHLCYIKFPKNSKNFCWGVLGEELIKNITTNKEQNIALPVETGDFHDMEYLGRYYKMEEC